MYLVVPPGGCFPETRRIELGPTALTIGRAEGCEIRLDVPGVDPEHAKMSEVALIALGPDCAIGDVPLAPGARRLLVPGDEVQIGSVVLALAGQDPSLLAPPPSSQATSPMVGAPSRPPRMEAPRVRVVEGATFGDELVLSDEGREYVIGRGATCDLVLDDREVSREHVKVRRLGHAIYVQDLSSTRGSWLGRAAVYAGATLEWARPRMLRVGATVLSLDLPDAMRRAAPAADPAPPPPCTPGQTPAPVSGTPPSLAPGSLPHGLGPLPPARPSRKAWKKTGPTIGKASGLLLLALAGLVILGGLFVVFSLLE